MAYCSSSAIANLSIIIIIIFLSFSSYYCPHARCDSATHAVCECIDFSITYVILILMTLIVVVSVLSLCLFSVCRCVAAESVTG
jgi:hypothetical protein